jgi:HEAT repeat protein
MRVPSDLQGFIRGLRSDDREIRIYSINSISHLGVDAASAISDLLTLWDDPDEDIARLSMRALTFLGPDILPLKPRVVALLGDHRPGIRQMAACLLGVMGPSAADTLPVLAPMLNDENVGVQMYAMSALANVADELDVAVETLRRALQHEDEPTRAEAEQALRREYAERPSWPRVMRDSAPPKPIWRHSVRSPSEEERETIAALAAAGRALLALGPWRQGPADVVTAIETLVDEARAGESHLTKDEIFNLSYLLGEQVRSASNWEWALFVMEDDVEHSPMVLVAPDHSLVWQPAATVHAALQDKDGANTIFKLFDVITCDRLPALEKPGSLVPLN